MLALLGHWLCNSRGDVATDHDLVAILGDVNKLADLASLEARLRRGTIYLNIFDSSLSITSFDPGITVILMAFKLVRFYQELLIKIERTQSTAQAVPCLVLGGSVWIASAKAEPTKSNIQNYVSLPFTLLRARKKHQNISPAEIHSTPLARLQGGYTHVTCR